MQRGDSETGGTGVAVAEREQHGMQKQGGFRQQTYHEGEGYIQGGKDTEVRNGFGAFQKGGIMVFIRLVFRKLLRNFVSEA